MLLKKLLRNGLCDTTDSLWVDEVNHDLTFNCKNWLNSVVEKLRALALAMYTAQRSEIIFL
jgi:hypothetical protein